MICPLVARTCAGSQCMAWRSTPVEEVRGANPHGPQKWGSCGMVPSPMRVCASPNTAIEIVRAESRRGRTVEATVRAGTTSDPETRRAWVALAAEGWLEMGAMDEIAILVRDHADDMSSALLERLGAWDELRARQHLRARYMQPERIDDDDARRAVEWCNAF